jgi:hypothetical protein
MTEVERRRKLSAAMCRTCIYFHPDVTLTDVDFSQTEAGECRCQPPQRRTAEPIDGDVRAWPIVYPGDWCGMFIPDTDD